MMRTQTRAAVAGLLGVVLALCAGPGGEGGNARAAPSGAGGAGTASPGGDGPSLGIVLTSKQARYKLKGGEEKIAARLRELQAAAEGSKKAIKNDEGPPAPVVDMTLRITNRSKHRVDFWPDGDLATFTLRLDGPGAVTASMPVMVTMELRITKVVTLGPGETFDLPITSLEFGNRNIMRAYWTRPGDYSLTPSLETAVRPAPAGTPADKMGVGPMFKDFGRVELTGPPLKVHVDAP